MTDETDATWWGEIEESLAADGSRIPPTVAGWRILEPKTPGQRCACTAPDSPHRASGRAGERRVCPHGKVWELVDQGVGHMFLRWVELHGLARWWAARKARP